VFDPVDVADHSVAIDHDDELGERIQDPAEHGQTDIDFSRISTAWGILATCCGTGLVAPGPPPRSVAVRTSVRHVPDPPGNA
jgi:hypothetical protein